ncbi:betaine--homocysteine S-methyltransferase 1-like [Amphiura filiformis]|uniref:betaine--homocysteine S-methyltransferase 1-like n=1 Tax=Amphiura filiformis TaxID=82378 RepID=UPI003B21344F
MAQKVKGLLDRLQNGETILCAEGYLFQFERRGYLKAGAFVPEIVLEHPQLLRQQYEEYVHAGSDVVLAFTYYAHRAKLEIIDREKDIEKLNRTALTIAREVANDTGKLMAGNICNTTLYNPQDPEWKQRVALMFKEQIEWAVDAGADFIIGETFGAYEEASLALECIKKYGKGLPAVVNIAYHRAMVNNSPATFDNVELVEALRRLETEGADVVGLNCALGPDTMLPLIVKLKEAIKIPIAVIPVAYRTTEKEPNFQALTDPRTGKKLFPLNLDCMFCTRDDMYEFGQRCKEMGLQFVGICCGNSAHLTRSLAESLGKSPPASRYSPNMDQHYALGKLDTNAYNVSHVKTNL